MGQAIEMEECELIDVLEDEVPGFFNGFTANTTFSVGIIQETHEQVEINTRTSFIKAIMNQDKPITLVQKRSSSTLSSSVAWMETPDQEIVPRPMKTRTVTREGIPAVPTAKDGIRWLNDLGFSYSSIAELVGAPLDTIKSIAAGRRSGKKLLEKLQALVEDADITEDKRRTVTA